MTSPSNLLNFTVDQDKCLYDGFYRLNQYTVTHDRFNGKTLTIRRELMDRPDAVVIMLADFSRDELVFIEQFRIGAMREDSPWLIEMVAGLIDKNEEPEQVARREAMEEAGVLVGRVEFISRYLPSPGGTNECVHLFIGEVDATTAEGVHGLETEGEDIRVVKRTFVQAYADLQKGLVNNAAGIIGLQWLQMNENRLRALWS